jgi:protein-L-isoaspartate(D-aspartate) O-methyltransferase
VRKGRAAKGRFRLDPMWGLLVSCMVCSLVFCITTLRGGASQDPAVLSERQAERARMVREGIKGFGRTPITDPAVLSAMERVPRHLFVPPDVSPYAYQDSALPIGAGQTISQPYIVALMTQALELKPGMKVLEVGTGSGYQAAVLEEMTPAVFTIEIIKALCESARDRLKRLGYHKAQVRLGDGYYGWPELAPFDRIIVTCAALHIPPPLFEQLSPGGKMLIPVGGNFETQRLLLVSKDESGGRTSKTIELVRFVPLVRGTSEK